MNRILVTPRSLSRGGHPAVERLKQAGFEIVAPTPGEQPGEDDLIAALPGCVGYLCGVEPVSARALEAADQLRYISRNGTGINNIDLEKARELGIEVLRAEGANARGVAELTIGLIFASTRAIPQADRDLKQQQWNRTKGIEVAGRTLGLVGCGQIGQIVARMATALGLRVLAFDPYPDRSFEAPASFAWADLEAIWADADIISLHCPPPPGGRILIDAGTLAKCRRGAFLINTARAELLDEKAVLKALDDGQLAGLALDAFRREPPGDDPLVRHPKVIATPHIGAFTTESIDRAAEVAVDKLLAALAGD